MLPVGHKRAFATLVADCTAVQKVCGAESICCLSLTYQFREEKRKTSGCAG